MASQTIEETREIAYNLRPFQLDRLGLTKAIQAMIRHLAFSSKIDFQAAIDSVDGVSLSRMAASK